MTTSIQKAGDNNIDKVCIILFGSTNFGKQIKVAVIVIG